MHELGVAGGDHVDFLVLSAPTTLVFNLAREDDVGVVRFGELVLDGADCRPSRRLLGGRGGGPGGGGGNIPSPLVMRVSQWHFRVVWLDGFAPLWNLQGASRVCS